MRQIDRAFQRFFETTTLSETMRQQVSQRLSTLQGQLQRNWSTPAVHPIGSYARGTLVPPVRDADVLFVYGSAHDGSAAAAVLSDVWAALTRHYDRQKVRTQRHSVRVQFQDFALDVVPAFGHGEGAFWIPELVEPGDLYRGGEWITTSPLAHEERLRRANERSSGGVRDLIVALKSMNQQHGTRLKSFHLEALVLAEVERATPSGVTFAERLPARLDALAEGVWTSSEAYLTTQTRAEIAQRYRNDAATLREALRRDDASIARKAVPGLP